ncbi:hypothetical protein AAG570_008940 [Ranatra chinensis]|uniref:Uncharacterized protein n=1 Tax=Ranatra chinensis TaxID=642074 RepID=A0ABD0ZDH8_9HEMI
MQMTENVCARLLKEKEVWTPIIQALNPRFTCPLKMLRIPVTFHISLYESENIKQKNYIPNDNMVTFKLYRCPSFSEKDKCEFVVKFNFQGDVCNKLKDRNQFWSNYIFAIKPDFKCPVLKGEYKVTNATFNPATFEALTSGVDQYYWRVHVHALDGKESVLCMLFGGEFLGRQRYIIQVRELEKCPSVRNTIMDITTRLDMISGGQTAFSINITVPRRVNELSKIKMVLHKCPSFAEVDNCEFFMRNYFKVNACKELTQKGRTWSSIIQQIKPKLECPTEKGTYTLKNVTIEPNFFLTLMPNAGKYYWQIYFTTYEGKQPVLCLKVGAGIAKIAGRQRPIIQVREMEKCTDVKNTVMDIKTRLDMTIGGQTTLNLNITAPRRVDNLSEV